MISPRLHLVRFALLACLSICLSLPAARAMPIGLPDDVNHSVFLPVYHIPLYVHIADSGRSAEEFAKVFAEINRIWLSQAGIYFDIEVVRRDAEFNDGVDMYFSPDIGGLNGYYDGELIRMSDHPRLSPAAHPSESAAGRTAAHELGHLLGLSHRQESDDNLMRSKTRGWHLNAAEVKIARDTARLFTAGSTLESRQEISEAMVLP